MAKDKIVLVLELSRSVLLDANVFIDSFNKRYREMGCR